MNPRHLELLHRAFDEDCSPDELRELDALLAGDPELRREQERLRALEVRLRLLTEEEPPADLLAEVFEQLPAAQAPARRSPRPLRREIVAFAAGIAATLLLMLGLNRDALRGVADQATGPLLPPEGAAAPIRGGAGEFGELRFVPSADGEWLELRWRADRPASFELDYEDSSEAHLEIRSGGETLKADLTRPKSANP